MQLTQNTYFGEGNRYYLDKLLGRGGFSEVWLAKDAITDLELVLKVYAPGTGMDEDGLQTFSKELARVYHLNHPNLLRPQHVDSWQGMPYLLMAYCAQGSLVKQKGGMSEKAIRKVLHDVASGLAYLHAHDVIHQDIKPDNVLLDDAGNYVITDFGISTRARSTLRKSVGASAAHSGGTIAYMGPERFGKEPAPIKASDVWSLGAMLYELMTGDTPFGEHGGLIQKSGAEIPTIQGNYSDELKQMVEQMLALNPWDRPTAEDLAAGYSVPSAPTVKRIKRIKSRSSSAKINKDRIWAIILFCVLLGLAVVIGVNMYNIGRPKDVGTHNGHEWVDLGLSVKWATCNVGATAPEEYGNYYAWGEVKPKKNYCWETYKYSNGTDDSLTKYISGSDEYTNYLNVDSITITTLDKVDDAATHNWGGRWRMPSAAEWAELREQCSWTWTTRNNAKKGYEVTSKINGNSIFLPAAGFCYDTELDDANSMAFYWSSALDKSDSSYAWVIAFDEDYFSMDSEDRFYGLSVRPVCP